MASIQVKYTVINVNGKFTTGQKKMSLKLICNFRLIQIEDTVQVNLLHLIICGGGMEFPFQMW